MDDTARLERAGQVGVITLSAPPVNALGHALRAGLASSLDAALADPGVHAIVIRADGPLFSAGADIREFGQPARDPLLGPLCLRIEQAAKPVIAIIHGAALGGGAEIALAAHYRLAGPAARIGLPEVRLGLIPGAGGTQRLPRLIGAEAALVLMTEGQSLDAAAAESIGLVDGILPDPTAAAAAAFAEGLLSRGLGPRPTCDLADFTAEGAIWLSAVAEARAVPAPAPLLARSRIIDCVEAALLLPPEAGLAFERAAFEDCLASAESQALRHLFLAERRLPPALGGRGPDGVVQLSAAGQALATRLDDALTAAAAALIGADLPAEAVESAVARVSGAPGPADPALCRNLTAAVMAEGGRLLAQGAVIRPADIDVIAVAGAGWPRVSGGPMHAAARAGLAALLPEMEDMSALHPVWTPPPVLHEAIKFAAGFDAIGDAPAAAAALVSPG